MTTNKPLRLEEAIAEIVYQHLEHYEEALAVATLILKELEARLPDGAEYHKGNSPTDVAMGLGYDTAITEVKRVLKGDDDGDKKG